VDVRYQGFPDVPHVWHTSYPRLPAAVEAMEQVAAFIAEVTKGERVSSVVERM